MCVCVYVCIVLSSIYACLLYIVYVLRMYIAEYVNPDTKLLDKSKGVYKQLKENFNLVKVYLICMHVMLCYFCCLFNMFT